jgi:hypothetical protein
VLAATGRDLAVPVAEEPVGLLVELDRARQPALVVEDAADEHEPLDEVRPQPGDQQRHGRAVAAATRPTGAAGTASMNAIVSRAIASKVIGPATSGVRL